MKIHRFLNQTIHLVTVAGLLLLIFNGVTSCKGKAQKEALTRTVSFDHDWCFIKDSLINAADPDFDDSGWRILNVPHDWSIEDLPGQNGEEIVGPFDKAAIDKMSSGYTVGGIGWYRKSFTTKPEDEGKIFYLQFDGVYMNSDVWINGKHLGFHPYGYTPFSYDITEHLNQAGQKNIVAVRVRNEGLNSRWYSGSGINRHVWLTAADPLHVDISGGIYITTPEVSETSADVRIVTTLVNSGSADEKPVVKTQIFDESGKVVANATSESGILPGRMMEVVQNLKVLNPGLWSIEDPVQYTARVSLVREEREVDVTETQFGIRSIKIDAQNGLTINGKQVDLIGGCYHHDNGPLGAASIDRAEERKIEILKKYGFNAIRTSHNPPSAELLDACDRLGMVVIDEIFDMWETPKKEQDYHLYFREWWQKDVDSWIKRDRNHPSVIMWSIGNEIREAADTSGYRIATDLTGEIRSLDSTRAITEAMLGMGPGSAPGRTRWDDFETHLELLDVVGYNYAFSRYESDHEKYPERIMIGTETNPPFALENYELVKKLPYVIGYFVWTATDNIGEAGVGLAQLRDINEPDFQRPLNAPAGAGAGGGFFRRDTWPVYTNYQGDIDLIGNRKVPSFYQYVVWGKSKVEMFVHRPLPEGKREVTSRWGFPDELKSWNWEGNEGKKFQVHVYTRYPKVKLELNGKVVGEQDIDPAKSITATFEVPYEPGKLVARCYENGQETASETIKTSGKPATIRLTADRTRIDAGNNDLSYVMAEILDREGDIVPDADNIIVSFEVSGKGKVAGVGSGDPRDISSFQQPLRKTWQGICMAVIRPGEEPGKITVRATAQGLRDAAVVITSR